MDGNYRAFDGFCHLEEDLVPPQFAGLVPDAVEDIVLAVESLLFQVCGIVGIGMGEQETEFCKEVVLVGRGRVCQLGQEGLCFGAFFLYGAASSGSG